jgi:ribosomal protein S12 methylthiotransferase
MCPEITIRSTFIAGFPGETEEEFEYLLDFLKEAEIDRLGCFAYSPVEGATANELANQLPDDVREDRRRRVMELQEEISKKRLQAKIGKTVRVLIDSLDRSGGVGRSSADAPEIDGVVYVKPPFEPHRKLKVGEFVTSPLPQRMRMTCGVRQFDEVDVVSQTIADCLPVYRNSSGAGAANC